MNADLIHYKECVITEKFKVCIYTLYAKQGVYYDIHKLWIEKEYYQRENGWIILTDGSGSASS